MKMSFTSIITKISQTISRLNPNLLFATTVLPLAAVLVFILLGDKSLWIDEAFTITIAQMDWPDFWETVSQYEANQGIYYLIMKFWLVFGDSEFALRSFSALTALCAVVAMYVLGKHIFGWRIAIVAALLITVNAFFIALAQDARSYMLALLLAILSSYFFIRAIEKSGWKWWVAFGLASVLGVYSHIYITWLLIAQFISLVFLPRREIPWKGLIISGISVLVLLIPMAYFALTRDIGQIGWASTPGPGEILQVFHHMTGRGEYFTAIVYFILCIVALSATVRVFMQQRLSLELWRHALILCCLFLPIIMSFLFSFIKPIFYHRYFLMFVPFLAIYTALGIIHLRRRWLILAAVGIIMVVSIVPFMNWYTNNPDEHYTHKQEWQDIVSGITTSAEPNDAIVFFFPFAKLPYDYYFHRIDDPPDTPKQVHYYSDEENLNIYQLPGEGTLRETVPNPDKSIIDRLSGYENIWLVLAYTSREERQIQREMLYDILEEEYGIPQEWFYDDPFLPINVYYFTPAEK